MPLVTVVIPAYNPGVHIVPAIESVLSQTAKDWEIVVVDDGSTEDLSYLCERFPLVRKIRQDNHGLSIARNVAILASDSQYVAFLDADDVWAATKLARQIELMNADPLLGMCSTKWAAIDAAGVRTRDGCGRPFASYEQLLEGCHICISSVLVRRSALAVSGLFNPFLKITQDYDMWLKIIRYRKIGYIPTCETFYRIHGNNMTGDSCGLYCELVELLGQHFDMARHEGNVEAMRVIRRALNRYKSNYGATAFDKSRQDFRQRDWQRFFKHYRFAFRLLPGYVTACTLRHLAGIR